MKLLQNGFVIFLIYSLALQGCAHGTRAPANEVSDKNPTIYRYHGLLKAPPFQHLLTFIAEKGLKIYLKKIPLEPEVRTRLNKNLESKEFSKFFVPFALGMKELYVAAKKSRKNNFRNYVLKNLPDPKQIPGLEHSLFSYTKDGKLDNGPTLDAIDSDERDETGENESSGEVSIDPTNEAILIASVITILDAVVLQNEEFSLATPPRRLTSTVKNATPPTRRLLEAIKANTDPKNPAYPAIESLMSSESRIESMAVFLIEAIHYFAYKHYQMFAARYQRKIALRDEFTKSYKTDPGKLAAKLSQETSQKRFGVQILVDGLGGHITEALSLGKASSPLLLSLHREKLSYEKFRPKKVPYRLLDGTQENFYEFFMAKNGFQNPAYLSFFKNLYRYSENGIALTGNSTTPTISARNVPIIQTGAPVEGIGATHLVNMHFINRHEDRAYYFFGNDALLESAIAKAGGMQTLAERLPELDSLNCMAAFESGYHWSIDPLVNIAMGEASRDFGEILCLRELQRRSKNEAKMNRLKKRFYELVKKGDDRQIRKNNLLSKIAFLENESMPALLTFFSPWIDHFAHFKGPMSDEIISPTGELNRLDYWLGRLTKLYENAGINDRTLFVMAGDHGLTPVRYLLNPEKAVFGTLIDEGYDIKLNKISSDEGEGPKLTDPLHPPTQHGFDVVVASTAGGNYMVDLFIDQNSNWSRQPTYADLIHYRLLSGQEINVVNESIVRLDNALDYLVVRDEDCSTQGGAVRVLALRNGARVEAKITRRHNRIFYESSSDLLEIRSPTPYSVESFSSLDSKTHRILLEKCVDRASVNDISSWCNEDEWRDLTSYTPRPDSVGQLAHLYDIDHAGTINLFPAPYVGYNSLVPGRHAGELFLEKNAFVGVWGKPLKLRQRVRSSVNGSIAPTLFEYLSGQKSGGADNGWGYRSLLNE